MRFWVIQIPDAIVLHGHLLRPNLWGQFVITKKMINFQGQTSLRAGKSIILPIFTIFLVIQNSEIIFAKNLYGHPLRPYQ